MDFLLVISMISLFSFLLFMIPTHNQYSKLLKIATSIQTHLKWAWNFLLLHSLFPNYNYLDLSFPGTEEVGVRRYKKEVEEHEVECAVCLCGIEEGEEIRELMRCNHVFHKVCLDRWIGFRQVTCPLCRGSIGSPVVEESGMEVLVFRFGSFSGHDRDSWWLR